MWNRRSDISGKMQELLEPSEPTRSSRPLQPLRRKVQSRRQRSRKFVASSLSSCRIVQRITAAGARMHSTKSRGDVGASLRCTMLRTIFGSGLSIRSVTRVTDGCDAQTSSIMEGLAQSCGGYSRTALMSGQYRTDSVCMTHMPTSHCKPCVFPRTLDLSCWRNSAGA